MYRVANLLDELVVSTVPCSMVELKQMYFLKFRNERLLAAVGKKAAPQGIPLTPDFLEEVNGETYFIFKAWLPQLAKFFKSGTTKNESSQWL